MAYLFPSEVGVPTVVTDPRATPATLSAGLGGWAGTAGTNCVITGIAGSTTANVQFLMTLRNFTYVYVFGERMGDYVVSGVTLAGSCWGGSDGMAASIGYYNTNAVSTTGTPVTITLGGYGTYAFLIGASFSATDPESRLGRFEFRFKTLTQ